MKPTVKHYLSSIPKSSVELKGPIVYSALTRTTNTGAYGGITRPWPHSPHDIAPIGAAPWWNANTNND